MCERFWGEEPRVYISNTTTRLEKATDPVVVEDVGDYLERKNTSYTENIKLMNKAISERGTPDKPNWE